MGRWSWAGGWILACVIACIPVTNGWAQKLRVVKGSVAGRIGSEVFGSRGRGPLSRAAAMNHLQFQAPAARAVAAAHKDHLIGITWGDSRLVSFDPYIGAVTEIHTQLNPREDFRGLAYDPNHNKLYALSQVENNLYSIDPMTLSTSHIGDVHIDRQTSWGVDAGALAYDTVTDALFTVIEHWDSDNTTIWSELVEIDIENAALRRVGRIPGSFITSMDYNDQDGYLYGVATQGVGGWDSPYKSHVIRINPDNAVMSELFETPYHTVLGFAKKPGKNTYLSWINWTSHFYGEINLDTQTITPLGNADAVGVISALIYRNFDVGPTPLPLEEMPVSFSFTGHVTEVWDPYNLLNRTVAVGDNFSGEFSYDINAPYKDPDPNHAEPYGVSVTINGLNFFSKGFDVQVVNNKYDDTEDSVSDSFLFDSSREDSHLFPIPMYFESISWQLTDYSGEALLNNNILPVSFDLSVWDENFFYISAGDDPYGEGPHYYISGVVETINANAAIQPAAGVDLSRGRTGIAIKKR